MKGAGRPLLLAALAFGAWVRPLAGADPKAPSSWAPPAIEDNSFFVEEAYNQEEGVVQHISTFARFTRPERTSDFSFTQEWPVPGQTHQLSLTLPYSWAREASATGLGDVFLNYRYQVLGHENWAALAPRLSLVLPTAPHPSRKPGVQLNVPASKRLSAELVVHANLGATLLPATESRACNLGLSVIGLVTKKTNLMLEFTATLTSQPDERGVRVQEREWILSPGLRQAIDIGELQIVPGLALPLRRAGGRTSAGLFAYLSFEHPFKKPRAAADPPPAAAPTD